MKTLILLLFIPVSLFAFHPTVHCDDNIYNEENHEYVLEVLFNHSTTGDYVGFLSFDGYPNLYALQILFSIRYYETIQPETKEWLENQFRYAQTFYLKLSKEQEIINEEGFFIDNIPNKLFIDRELDSFWYWMDNVELLNKFEEENNTYSPCSYMN